jgi:GTP cyclohydrolase I
MTDRLEKAFKAVFAELWIAEDDAKDRALDVAGTPRRLAKMYNEELLSSYAEGSYDRLCNSFTCFPSDGADNMVLLGPIGFYSTCAHHLLPFDGVAYVGYVPKNLLIGASKSARVVDYFSRMLQIQERLSRQIADFIAARAQPRWVGVLLDASHMCMRCRGVRQENSRMVTTALWPRPADDDRGLIQEFYSQVELLRKRGG